MKNILLIISPLCIFLFASVFLCSCNSKIELTEPELNYIWETMENHYAGFNAMEKAGLTKKEFFKAQRYDDLKTIFEKYMHDCHFYISIKDWEYRHPSAHDEGCSESKDPKENTYFEKETSNAYYVRFNTCILDDYKNNFSNVWQQSLDKDFLILDARSNHGGDDTPQWQLRQMLSAWGFKGTLLVLQDNWSFSSGEIWKTFGWKNPFYKSLLIGTHSGGMQNYGNCQKFYNEDFKVFLYFGITDYTNSLPSNYLGEGKGYEPNIWATTENMKSVLEELGVDTEGIIFQ